MAVPHKAIFLSAMNPRKDRGDLEGLKESILAHGIIEPLVVRHNGSGHTYELIVGERRLSALNELIAEGFFSEDVTVPVVLREMDDDNAKQMMIVENMMRKDLTELEQAQAFKDYLVNFPRAPLVANAYYWLGLSQFSLSEYPAAIATQQRLLKEYPDSAKVPDAMVSLARAHYQTGDADAGRRWLERVVAEHPASKAADTARKLLELHK